MLFTLLKRTFLALLIGLPVLLLLAWTGLYLASERELDRAHDRPELVAGSNPVGVALMDGERLARITGCYGCHGADLNGNVFFDQPRVARLVAPDLTRLVRLYSDQELDYIIRYGIRPDGSSVWAMPSSMYYHLNAADLAELIAHLRSLPEGNGPIREFRLGILGRIALVSGQFKPMAEEIPDVARILSPTEHPMVFGSYLARIACTECHGQDLRGAGEAPDLRMVIAYEEDAFGRLMREGIALGERELGLMRTVANSRFVHFTDDEVRALHAYLQSLIDEEVTAAGPSEPPSISTQQEALP